MRSSALLFVLLILAIACGKEDSTTGAGNGNNGAARKPVKPKIDPEEEARKLAEAERKKAEAVELKKARKKQIAELETQLEELKKANKKEAKQLPDLPKLRRRLSGMIRDSATAKSIYDSSQRRFDRLQKVVKGAATAELKKLQADLAKAEKAYYGVLSGVKEERAAQALGIVEETQVQKEIRALRAAKQEWFGATRETRRGGASTTARSQASSKFKTWVKSDPLNTAVVAKALPDGQTPDSYDFSELEFYLLMEILEDVLDRANFADEKKTISANDQKLIEMEKAIDALREAIAQQMIAGGGEMEEFTELSDNLPAQKRKAESLERTLIQMREVYNDIEEALNRHSAEEDALESQIAKLRKNK